MPGENTALTLQMDHYRKKQLKSVEPKIKQQM
jgi:hypothetical protein